MTFRTPRGGRVTKPAAEKQRIQKYLASCGVGSRRQIESLVAEGRITVNGKPAETGQQVGPDDRFQLDGKPVASRPLSRHQYLMYHKPVGEVCSRNDPEGRKTVFRQLPPVKGGRWINIGRLDINTDGLLIFTTDGELANALMHPSREVIREYAVRVLGRPDPDGLRRLTSGVELEDGRANFKSLVEGGGEGANRWFHVTLAEGRNREVRRLWEAVGLKVSRLSRVAYGSLKLPKGLARGRARALEVKEIRALYQDAGLDIPSEHAKPSRPPTRSQDRTRRKKSSRSNQR